jgi:Leucine-rich repeat (LRR) protein
LTPLHNSPLETLTCIFTDVADLSPLSGLPLQSLDCRSTRVENLAPLKDLPLVELWCDFKPERDAVVLRICRSLKKINDLPVAEFWKAIESNRGSKSDKSPPEGEEMR